MFFERVDRGWDIGEFFLQLFSVVQRITQAGLGIGPRFTSHNDGNKYSEKEMHLHNVKTHKHMTDEQARRYAVRQQFDRLSGLDTSSALQPSCFASHIVLSIMRRNNFPSESLQVSPSKRCRPFPRLRESSPWGPTTISGGEGGNSAPPYFYNNDGICWRFRQKYVRYRTCSQQGEYSKKLCSYSYS